MILSWEVQYPWWCEITEEVRLTESHFTALAPINVILVHRGEALFRFQGDALSIIPTQLTVFTMVWD